MTAPGNSVVLFVLLAAFLACTGYAAGRLHQWYRTGQDRDEAYRDGYDTATRSVFSMAARIIGPRRSEKAAIRASAAVRPSPSPPVLSPVPVSPSGLLPPSAAEPAAGLPAAGSPPSPPAAAPGRHDNSRTPRTASPGRHTVPDELVRAATYRLTPDRVARAKVRGETPPSDVTSRTSVPRPRSS
jgi:hypothetical protein